MKQLLPFALAVLLTACAAAPPADPHVARQQELAKEARANFIALKQQERPGQKVVLHDDQPPPTPTPQAQPQPKPQMTAFYDTRQPAPVPAPTAPPKVRPRATPMPKKYVAANSAPPPPAPTPHTRNKKHPNDQTVYYWQTQSARGHTTPREQVAEAKYARSLAKRVEELTPEERLYAHEHY